MAEHAEGLRAENPSVSGFFKQWGWNNTHIDAVVLARWILIDLRAGNAPKSFILEDPILQGIAGCPGEHSTEDVEPFIGDF